MLNRRKSESGQGMIEYALILVLVVVIVIVIATLFGPTLFKNGDSTSTSTELETPSAREYTTVDKEHHLICTHWEYGSNVAGSCVFVPADEWDNLNLDF